MAAIEKRATRLLFEVANRKRTESLPEWRKQYRALKDAGEAEQAECLWEAEIRKGMQAAQERIRESLDAEMQERYSEMEREAGMQDDLKKLFGFPLEEENEKEE